MLKGGRLDQGKHFQWTIHVPYLGTSMRAVFLLGDLLTYFILKQHFNFLSFHAGVAVLSHTLFICTRDMQFGWVSYSPGLHDIWWALPTWIGQIHSTSFMLVASPLHKHCAHPFPQTRNKMGQKYHEGQKWSSCKYILPNTSLKKAHTCASNNRRTQLIRKLPSSYIPMSEEIFILWPQMNNTNALQLQ